MSDPTDLSALTARLDRIEGLLARLVDRLEGTATPAAQPGGPAPAASAAPTPEAAPLPSHEPPRIKVAPPGPRLAATEPPSGLAAPAPAATSALASSSGLAAPVPSAPSGLAAPVPAAPSSDLAAPEPAGPSDLPAPEAAAPIETVLLRLFEAALLPNAEDTWAVLIRLFHSSQLVGPRSLDHFKGFAWPRLRRNARIYLQDGTPGSFRVAYTDPLEPRGHEKEIRVFMKANDERMPVPLVLTRDPAAGNAWRISNISL